MESHTKPSDVAADHGEVIIDGPDGVAVSLTPEAAIKTSERLREQGAIAQQQRADSDAPDARAIAGE